MGGIKLPVKARLVQLIISGTVPLLIKVSLYLNVAGTIIKQTGMDEEWGISESALALLRTLDKKYICDIENEEWLILHGCGTMLMLGCPISIHWTVKSYGRKHDFKGLCQSYFYWSKSYIL